MVMMTLFLDGCCHEGQAKFQATIIMYSIIIFRTKIMHVHIPYNAHTMLLNNAHYKNDYNTVVQVQFHDQMSS